VQPCAEEDLAPFGCGILSSKDSAMLFHYCADCALCRAVAGLEENRLRLDDGLGFRSEPRAPLMGSTLLAAATPRSAALKLLAQPLMALSTSFACIASTIIRPKVSAILGAKPKPPADAPSQASK
jgi:hypothetical protein